jgi:DNA-binding HxlR family transcriptional regulator
MKWDALSQRCPTRELLARIGDKWSVLVVTALEPYPHLRFSELKRQIEGISQKMLTQTLRELERDGFLVRSVEATVPVTVRYRLTRTGRGLAIVVAALRTWSYANIEAIQKARQSFDRQKRAQRQHSAV